MLAFEWTYLLFVFLILLSILLPDIIGIGRSLFHTHQAASHAIQRAAAQGQMTQEIANDTYVYLYERGIGEVGVYGTSELRGINSLNPNIHVRVETKFKPRILSILSGFVDSSLVDDEGNLMLTAKKLDASSVHIRN